jgi:hypothetical protein
MQRLKGLSQAARRYATSTNDRQSTDSGIAIFCNLSPLLSIAVKIGRRFNAVGQTRLCGRAIQRMLLRVHSGYAKRLCLRSGGFVLGRKTCIDDTARSLSPIEVLSNDAWNIRTTTFSNTLLLSTGAYSSCGRRGRH